MSYEGFMCSNKSLIQIKDLGRSNIILNICTIIIICCQNKYAKFVNDALINWGGLSDGSDLLAEEMKIGMEFYIHYNFLALFAQFFASSFLPFLNPRGVVPQVWKQFLNLSC